MRLSKNILLLAGLLLCTTQIVKAAAPENLNPAVAALNKGDTAGAIEYLLPLAKAGRSDAQFMLVSVLQSTDQKQAVEWLVIAAKNKHPSACHILGLMYLEGNGMPKDAAEGEKLLRCAVDGGEAGAQVALGSLYRYGNKPQHDDAEAVKLFRLAADQGFAEGQFRLAEMYRYGYGIEKNQEEAARLFRLAMTQGHAEAQKMLVEMGR